MSISASTRLTPILVLSLLFLSPESSTASDRCAADLQKEYGKYYSCALKAQSRATQNGSDTDLRRCQASLEKKLARLAKKYGPDCAVENPAGIVDVANECVQEITDLTTGLEPVPGPDDASLCRNDATASNVLASSSVAARKPPAVEEMSLTTLGGGRARFDVTFAEMQEGRCLPSSIPVLLGDREEVELVSANGRRKYSSEINLQTEEWQRYERELRKASAASGSNMVPAFDGRVQSMRGVAPTAPISIDSTDALNRLVALPLKPAIAPGIVDPDRTLMVRDVLVVEDPDRTFDPCDPVGTPMGPWTFGYLMQEMANQPLTGVVPSDFVLDWMDQWTTVQTVNGQSIAPRLAMQGFIDRWLLESAAAGAPPGQLDLSIAPFRLMAIVNRVDLRENASYGGGNCGEGRFVFGLLDTDTCMPARFTVIFEYGVNMTTCKSCKKYAQKWLDLQDHPLGSQQYLTELEAITHLFTDRNTNPGKPNGNSINQIRTNENTLNPVWEFREFNVGTNSLLGHVTTKQNPMQSLNNTASLGAWAGLNLADICAGDYTVPDTFFSAGGGGPFLSAHVPFNFGDFFNFPNSANTLQSICARFELSLNSCSGCHARETNTVFTHVGDAGIRLLGLPATLSGFLTGAPSSNPVTDPIGVSPDRNFNDLARRQIDLWNAANVPCLPAMAFQPLGSVH